MVGIISLEIFTQAYFPIPHRIETRRIQALIQQAFGSGSRSEIFFPEEIRVYGIDSYFILLPKYQEDLLRYFHAIGYAAAGHVV
jgi:hypothetical protein